MLGELIWNALLTEHFKRYTPLIVKKVGVSVLNIEKLLLGSQDKRLIKITDNSNQNSMDVMPFKFMLENWVPF